MGFVDTVKMVLTQKYAAFSGRASRSEFWWFILFYFLVVGVLSVFLVVMGALDVSTTGQMPVGAMIVIGLLAIFVLATIVPYIAVTVRRLHDRNISGWWYAGIFVLSLIPFVNIIGSIASLALLVICCLRGTPGPNKYGPDPLATHNAEVFR